MNWSDHFYYDETSPSCLRWKIDIFAKDCHSTPVKHKGDVAGWDDQSQGYYRVGFKGKCLLVHRIVYALFNGETSIKEKEIDHIDGCVKNNRIVNLRAVDRKQNSRNCRISSKSKTGVSGVHLSKHLSRNKIFWYWTASWIDPVSQKQKRKLFSILRFGNETAFEMACLHRKEMLEHLKHIGEGYTNRHGTI